MDVLQITHGLSTLLCTLVTGLLFTFAVVVMPGIQSLSDRDYLRSFKSMDRIIQNNQPLFVVVWLGSVVSIVIAAWLGFVRNEGLHNLITIIAALVYLIGVQWPTFAINVPLNNQLQNKNLDTMESPRLHHLRKSFEERWTRWNTIRTIAATTTSILLILASNPPQN